MNYSNKKIAILGFGVEGKDAASFLLSKGSLVTVLDKNEDLDKGDFESLGIRFILGEGYLERGLNEFDYIVRSPGIYRFCKEIQEAESLGVKVTSALQIFMDETKAKIIGVTGTKGKGTTSTLIYEILKEVGNKVFLVGNIGKPYLELLPKLDPDTWVVMEMSSFQLIDLKKSPDIAVVLNITSDHMDWHKNNEEYIDAKSNIVAWQNEEDYALLNSEYETSKSFASMTTAKVIYFSKSELPEEYKENLLLRGEHNLENIAAAVAVSKLLNIKKDKILQTIQNFKGLEHRLELVAEVEGVKYYNDSFATGPQPTVAAIKSFNEPQTVILGGSDKNLNFDTLAEEIKNNASVKNVILIGETAAKIKRALESVQVSVNLFSMGKPSMLEIVTKAKEVTPVGGVVVLSPACASFDMFKNYKDRGNQFKEAVLLLKNEK